VSETGSGRVGLAIAMLVVTPLFWAGHSVVGRIIANEIPTFSLVSLRWLAAFVLFMLFVHRRVWAERWLVIKYWRYVLMTSLIGPTLFPMFLYAGLKTTTVTNTSIIQALVPAMVPVLACVSLIIAKGHPENLTAVDFVPGDFLILAGFTAWSMYTVAIRMKPSEMHANTLLAAGMAIAGVVTLPLWIMEAANGEVIPMTAEAWWAIGYILLFPTLLAYYFYNHAISVVGPTKAGLASHLVPPLGILLGVIFLNEQLHGYHAASFAAVIIGVTMAIVGGRAAKTKALP
jgi:drug/metabolite transporter (DMT)-like permease